MDLEKTTSIQTSVCNVRDNVSVLFLRNFNMGDPGTFGSYLHDYRGQRLQICRSSSSKVIVGNGDLNSKSIVSTLCMVRGGWKEVINGRNFAELANFCTL